MQKNDKYQVMGAKVKPATRRLAERIARRLSTSVYKIVQMMIDVMVRYMDDRHNLTPEIEQMMAVFEHMDGWKDNFNLADPTSEPEIMEATYYLRDKTGKGVRAVHVEKPFFGQWTETYNVQHILERVFTAVFPERYRRLRKLAEDMDCGSILELLDYMIDAHTVESVAAELRKPFEDANRSEYGRTPAESPYRRKHHKDPDSIDRQQTVIHFTEEDRQLADEEAGREGTDFRPFDVEW